MASIHDLREPIEVYEAAIGDPAALIQYLRSGQPIGSWMRDALAAYLAGELKPELPRARPKRVTRISKLMQQARRDYFSIKFWKQQDGERVHGKSEKIRADIAESYGLITNQFEQEFHRGIAKPDTVIGLQARFLYWYVNTRMK